ncbi:MAG TPA: hypothetical protein VKB88_31205 [Bryobacteraceae bacterium]|nr:hypothetical protein [Bryobacteraceae bacterium]
MAALRYALPLALAMATIELAAAADAFYLGTWKIVEAKPAPWGDTTAWKQSAAETKSLLGRIVTIEQKAIRGPHQLACGDPKYQLRDYGADMLFQGMFGEMHAHDHAVDPVRVAENVGFHGSSWETLETGCEGMNDFHFIDRTTAAFGLNNYIYILKKQP